MSKRQKHSAFSEGASAIRGLEVFAAGRWRGKRYTRADLDAMAENFRLNSAGDRPGMRVPAVIGHDEDQRRLADTGLEAAAWTARLWRDGDVLKADLEDVPPEVARLVRGRRYRTVSAEVYDDPPEGLAGRGKMLRRIAFLGGDIPQVKGLADIPLPEPMSERRFDNSTRAGVKFSRAVRAGRGAWTVFTEVIPVDRDQMLAALAEHGIDVQSMGDVPDAALAEVLRALDAAEAEPDGDEAAPPPGEEDEAPVEMAEGEGMPSLPEPKDADEAKKMAEHCRRYYEKYMDGAGGEDVSLLTAGKGKPAMMSERRIAAIVRQQVADALKDTANEAVSTIRKFTEKADRAAKAKAVDAVVAELVERGKLPPAEREAERQGLLLLDDSVVHKFSEGGRTVERTAFDQRVALLRRRPSHFSERARDAGAAAPSPEEEQVGEVEAHYERFSEAFRKIGTDKATLVEGFKAERRRRPELTAREFLGA